jgi:hypothetical protein
MWQYCILEMVDCFAAAFFLFNCLLRLAVFMTTIVWT